MHRPNVFQTEWTRHFTAKLGLRPEAGPDLATRFLTWLAEDERDFTTSFRALAEGAEIGPEDWRADWATADPDLDRARAANPVVVPRLHLIEAAIDAAVKGDLDPFHDLLARVTRPFDAAPSRYIDPPAPEERVTRTFCGT